MKKVFILDDNAELLEIMDKILSPQFNVHVCSDRSGAMSKINAFQPDVIIVDYFIGSNSAEDIVTEIKASDPARQVPILLFSAAPNIAELAGKLGVAGYLEKPCSISKIRSYLKNLFAETASPNGG